jgi:hypothetical protein
MDFSDFIHARGAERIAKITAVPLNTVHQWATRKCVPRGRWPELLTAFPEVGLPAFQAMEVASRRQNAAT